MSTNGKLAANELSSVGTYLLDGEIKPFLLANTTARAWLAMKAAAATAGHYLTVAYPAGAYRDLFTQGDMKKRPHLYNLNTASSVALASPGYSTHGDGRSVDVANFSGSLAAWVLANCERFGFTRTFGSRDPNHFGHDGVTAPAIINTVSTKVKEIIDMADNAAIIRVVDGEAKDRIHFLQPGHYAHLDDGIEVSIMERATGLKMIELNSAEFHYVCDNFQIPEVHRVGGGHKWNREDDVLFTIAQLRAALGK